MNSVYEGCLVLGEVDRLPPLCVLVQLLNFPAPLRCFDHTPLSSLAVGQGVKDDGCGLDFVDGRLMWPLS